MNTARRYDFNLPWPAVFICAAFYGGASAYMVYLAREYVGLIFAFLITLSVILGILGLFMIARRLVFARVIELTDDGILYPRGFPKTHSTSIAYADILRIQNHGDGTQAGLTVATGRGTFAISASYFTHIDSYRAVRDFICAKTLIVIPREDRREPLKWGDWRIWGFPEPILRWNEPEDWPRYRTHLVKSKPLLSRFIRALWFFARCFAIFFIPWLLLRLLDVPTAEPAAYVCLAILVTLFITLIYHWFATIWPVYCTEISFRDNGITRFFGKQTADWNYHQFSNWAIVERRYERQSVLILLLKGRSGIISFAIPDIGIRDQLARLLHDKGISHTPELKPPWEDVA
jgi:hypothetical protein